MSLAAARIGVFGGAFDPPHRGHVALAQAALTQLGLGQLLVLPTGQAAHKQRPLSPASHRRAMCELAFAGLPRTTVDPRETLRSRPSFTVDTLEDLQRDYPQSPLCLLIGEDQARALPRWHRPGELARLATIYVAARTEPADTPYPIVAPHAEKAHPKAGNFVLHWLQLPILPISATDIRHRVFQRQDIDALVPEAIARYIAFHHLYQLP